jgi:hydroxymethylpyrimidine pyrophosphatase-like HAD family hydrolase
VAPIEVELERGWPGTTAVRERLSGLDMLTPQDVESPRRVAYWVEPVRARRDAVTSESADPFAARAADDPSLDEDSRSVALGVAARAADALRPLPVDVLLSANVFLDVLPRGVNKGGTLLRVLRWLGLDAAECVVAGDSLNDLSLFETGLRGIVVGNCEPALLQQVTGMQRVYRARGIGAAGVLEGLRHYGHAHGAPGTEGQHDE